MSRKSRAPFRAGVNRGNVRLAEKRPGKASETHLAAPGLRTGDLEAMSNRCWAASDPHPAVRVVRLRHQAKEAHE